MSTPENVDSGKCPFRKTSIPENVHSGKRRFRKTSIPGNGIPDIVMESVGMCGALVQHAPINPTMQVAEVKNSRDDDHNNVPRTRIVTLRALSAIVASSSSSLIIIICRVTDQPVRCGPHIQNTAIGLRADRSSYI